MIGASVGQSFLADLVARHMQSVLAACEPKPVVSQPVVTKVMLVGDVEGLITGCCESVRGLALRFARSSDGRVDADDMYGVGMLEICEAVATGRLARAEDPKGYLVGVARLAMINEWRRLYGRSTISLDKPLTDDSSATLHDVLAAPSDAAPVVTAEEVKRAKAVRGALRRLTPRRREALRKLYGFHNSLTYTANDAAASLHYASGKQVQQIHRRALAALRADACLRVEVVR
jgi:DNA-directed RNA polymerase specialized sigma24 family protein